MIGGSRARLGRGFTLLEVVIALVIVEVTVVGVLTSLTLSARLLRRGEVVQRVVASAESVRDSLALGASAGADSLLRDEGWVRWIVSGEGRLRIVGSSDGMEIDVLLESMVPIR